MNIDRTNYEIWFTDWIDNVLSDSGKEELYAFLKKNPDLEEEFEELRRIILDPSPLRMHNKEKLLKHPDQLGIDQFDLMAVAAIENDLDAGQKREVLEMAEQDPDKMSSFKLISRTKLVPPQIVFRRKHLLLKKTIFARVNRLTVTVASAAAVVTIMILSGVFRPREAQDMLLAGSKDTLIISLPGKITSTEPEPIVAQVYIKPSVMQESGDTGTVTVINPSRQTAKDPVPSRIEFDPNVLIAQNPVSGELVKSGIEEKMPRAVSSEERTDIGKFIALNFRKKILKEELPADDRLKGYEIAEAGVNGLNKLLGWEMAITRNTDESGELKSVYFSSKMLKFNAPVKKSEGAE